MLVGLLAIGMKLLFFHQRHGIAEVLFGISDSTTVEADEPRLDRKLLDFLKPLGTG